MLEGGTAARGLAAPSSRPHDAADTVFSEADEAPHGLPRGSGSRSWGLPSPQDPGGASQPRGPDPACDPGPPGPGRRGRPIVQLASQTTSPRRGAGITSPLLGDSCLAFHLDKQGCVSRCCRLVLPFHHSLIFYRPELFSR